MNELSIGQNYVRETTTDEDPDGSDRGGFHQVVEELKIVGSELVHGYSTSDYYKDRFGEPPGPEVSSKDDAVHYLRQLIERSRQEQADLEAFLARVTETTTFKDEYEAPEEDEEGEEEDEENDE